MNEVRNSADQYLAAIEAVGIEQFFGPTDGWQCEPVRRIYDDLKVFSGSVTKWKEPGYIRLALPGGGGAVGAVSALVAVEQELAKDDNRRKLAASGARDRYLLVYIDPQNFLPWKGLLDFEPPDVAPMLPEEITHVWAFTEDRAADSFAIWRGGVTSSWRRGAHPSVGGAT